MIAEVNDNPPLANGHSKGTETGITQSNGTIQQTVDQLTEVSSNLKQSEVAERARDWTDQALNFLSNASNETLGACLVGLGAITYFVLGRVGLVIIGAVIGVVLHATWEGNGSGEVEEKAPGAEARRRREKGLDIAQRLLKIRNETDGVEPRDVVGDSTTPLKPRSFDFSGFQLETKRALERFTDAVVGDYVQWWYHPLLPKDSSFPIACRQVLTQFLFTISNHVSRKRPADTFLDFLTNSSSIVIVFLSELSTALAGVRGGDFEDAVQQYLEENPGGSLANVLDKEQQDRKLKAVAEDILQSFLESSTFACEPVRVFLREVLAGLVLQMTVTSCSKADFINEWIIFALEEGKTTELVQAIDAGVSGAAANASVKESEITNKAEVKAKSSVEHRRTISRAEDAMDEAMQEAKRLSKLIAAEDSKAKQAPGDLSSSDAGTAARATPTSSPNDLLMNGNGSLTALTKEGKDAEHSPRAFTSFDQIISAQQPTALQSKAPLYQPQDVPPLTLHNANVSIFDDSVSGEKGNIRAKPTAEYLLQIEPATSQYPGWMIARKYADFETLHEVLRRISVISGIGAFTESHQVLPGWKTKTKATLRTELEQYLRDALSFQRLAESEGMKRFLEKEQAIGRSSPNASSNKGGFGFPNPAAFETMGKGMLDVLASAPKGAAGGGKALLGGVTGVLGGVGSIGQRKHTASNSTSPAPTGLRSANSYDPTLAQMSSNGTAQFGAVRDRESQESSQTSTNESMITPSLPPRPSQDALGQRINDTQEEQPARNTILDVPSNSAPSRDIAAELHLPPPPSEIADDYNARPASPRPSVDGSSAQSTSTSPSTAPTTYAQSRRSTVSSLLQTEPIFSQPTKRNSPSPFTIEETSIAVELFFATINELYSLSSAWTLRLTLLNAAKSFLLRPGNPNLEAIRQLLQTTIIDANTSDTGIATHINKVRENALPTQEELAQWPSPPSEGEKEDRRKKARKLLVEKGMPQALTSVMGTAASGEALGKVFDCLQIPDVASGLVFALVLQGVRAITQ